MMKIFNSGQPVCCLEILRFLGFTLITKMHNCFCSGTKSPVNGFWTRAVSEQWICKAAEETSWASIQLLMHTRPCATYLHAKCLVRNQPMQGRRICMTLSLLLALFLLVSLLALFVTQSFCHWNRDALYSVPKMKQKIWKWCRDFCGCLFVYRFSTAWKTLSKWSLGPKCIK